MWLPTMVVQLLLGPPPPPVCDPGEITSCTIAACAYATQTCSTLGQWGSCYCKCKASGQCETAVWSGTCVKSPKPVTTPCNDFNSCTYSDHCSGSTNLCVGGGNVSCVSDQCTTRTCNGTSQCVVSYATSDTPCDDGNLCTHTDRCASGVCAGATVDCPKVFAVTCLDPYTCNGTPTCTIHYRPAGTWCIDTNACNGVDTCDAAGQCIRTTPAPIIDDSNPCTTDYCDPVTGAVSHTNRLAMSSCSDGNPCNGDETCNAAGQCYRPNLRCPSPDCTCAPTGCLNARTRTDYCYDDTGNMTSQVEAVYGQSCQIFTCPAN